MGPFKELSSPLAPSKAGLEASPRCECRSTILNAIQHIVALHCSVDIPRSHPSLLRVDDDYVVLVRAHSFTGSVTNALDDTFVEEYVGVNYFRSVLVTRPYLRVLDENGFCAGCKPIRLRALGEVG